MTALSLFSFASPWLLTGLLLLPLLYLVLRVIPPHPQQVKFPPIRLLAGLAPESQTARQTPWWLLVLRMLIAALMIIALAGPKLDAGDRLPGRGAVVLVIDNGWASAGDWPQREKYALGILARAAEQSRAVILLPTAKQAATEARPLAPMSATAASAAVRVLQPQPWPTDRAAALAQLTRLSLSRPLSSIWIHDGLDSDGAAALAAHLADYGPLQLRQAAALKSVLTVQNTSQGDLQARLTFDQSPRPGWQGWLRATGGEGRLLWRGQVAVTAGARDVVQTIDLPLELRNEITRLALEGSNTAASVALLDERYRRRSVGILSTDDQADQQTLLEGNYYISRALAPVASVRYGAVEKLLAAGDLSMMVLGDDQVIDLADRTAIEGWIRNGGVLLRFAGENLAAAKQQDGSTTEGPLTPVRLRRGDRVFGSALSWGAPGRLAPFGADSPFHGLSQPDDVLVHKQVLAEPSLELAQRSWARLDDGTPIVTAKADGRGWLVLMHTTANTAWSNLALSGLFVDMLKRLVSLSRSAASGQRDIALPPLRSLDGFGRLGAPPATAEALPKAIAIGQALGGDAPPGLAKTALGPRRPPGFYGTSGQREAVNLGPTLPDMQPQKDFPAATQQGDLRADPVIEFKAALLLAALLLFLLDGVVSVAMRGAFRQLAKLAVMFLALTASLADNAQATDDAAALRFALTASLQTHLAFVKTGDPTIDTTSEAGLNGLSQVLRSRTAVEPGPAVGVNLDTDALAFFPLLYWPISPAQPALSAQAEGRVNAYLSAGGMILFDTRDQHEAGFGSNDGPGFAKFRQIANGIAIPPLAVTPEDHVLTRSFYLLKGLPGRYQGGPVWIAEAAVDSNRSVSSVVIGRHDWASAWARDGDGRSRFPVVPGGEVQREMAYRFGVNLVMYALTGNYKADQVHIPTILERLGQ